MLADSAWHVEVARPYDKEAVTVAASFDLAEFPSLSSLE